MNTRMSRAERRRLASRILVWLILVALAAAIAAAFVISPSFGFGRRYEIPVAAVTAEANRDGTLLVTEQISMTFHGSFTGAYRDIPTRANESVDVLSVSEGGIDYAPGANTALGSYGAPDTFGVDDSDPNLTRIVWHYTATDETRTFTIKYRAVGAIGRGPDSAQVSFKPWGSNWKYPLGKLDTTLLLPPGTKPADVTAYMHFEHGGVGDIDVTPAPGDRTRVHLFAHDIPKKSAVELRAVGPKSMVAPNADVPTYTQSRAAIAAEEAPFQKQQRDDIAKQQRPLLVKLIAPFLVVFAAGLLAVAWAWFVYACFGREIRVHDVPDRLPDPPSELSPLLAASLTAQTVQPQGEGLSAIVFDLIRRDYYTTLPAVSGKNGTVVDIAIKIPKQRPDMAELLPVERSVLDLIDAIVPEEGIATGAIVGQLTANNSVAQVNFSAYQANARAAISAASWFSSRGPGLALLILPVLLLLLAVWGLFVTFTETTPLDRPMHAALLVACIAAIGVLGLTAREPKLVTRRRRDAAQVGAQWDAFRRYLEEYGHFGDEQPASLPLWERYLVYAIAFGCASQIAKAMEASGVLDTDEGRASTFGGGPPLDSSIWMWSNLGRSMGAASAPPSSSGTDGGSSWGGFGGGGGFGSIGGGFGGGGGGAW